MSKIIKITAFFLFFVMCVCVQNALAESCTTAGTTQEKYTATGCTYETETRTCCSDGTWSEWDEDCEEECEDWTATLSQRYYNTNEGTHRAWYSLNKCYGNISDAACSLYDRYAGDSSFDGLYSLSDSELDALCKANGGSLYLYEQPTCTWSSNTYPSSCRGGSEISIFRYGTTSNEVWHTCEEGESVCFKLAELTCEKAC